MRPNFVQKFDTLSSALALAAAGLIGSMTNVTAQQNVLVCQPPRPGEYLLLVVSPTASSQKQLRSALPNEIQATTCQYLTDTVTRIGGFNRIEDANRWATYVNNIVGLSATITTRPTAANATQAPTPPQTISFNPQVLGDGYAVLVEYFNKPEMANSLQQVVGGNIGFASYGQRPYLLAVYTRNQQEAYNTLQKLNERGFFAVLVDGSKVMLLRSSVRL
ncbi:hypothetical protein [Nodularia sphaerocarpa]|uniref:hypothetical protein n=1 Tax=Nodularia sphaerocarpa TaxID=137816 RepID=UPI001EFC19A2|nr:hypothetical protein [Nodularia sphaerocarpa]MDB9375920.1 hypothetical protein [Nodularia sphaerocarpa CS-585]MDB9379636.1 hypothetical protein [Nodularia sphaerocarpa CS-585A2]ULP74710.1 hypothetical protein BDGGKGIB_04380 [Nodularia sphaerocarpa UHCC 0038]